MLKRQGACLLPLLLTDNEWLPIRILERLQGANMAYNQNSFDMHRIQHTFSSIRTHMKKLQALLPSTM